MLLRDVAERWHWSICLGFPCIGRTEQLRLVRRSCVFVKNSWCAMSHIKEVVRYCSPEVEYLMISCRPHYLPRVLICIIVAVYLPPQTDAGTKTTLNELYQAISKQDHANPEATLLVAADYNAGTFKSILPHFYQHVKCATRGKITLDHLYSTQRHVQSSPSPSIW